MSSKRQYTGAARFIEIAPIGIAHRIFANVDHLTTVSFSQAFKEVPGEDENGGPTVERLMVGFKVVINIGGVGSEYTFNQIDIAMAFYNEVLNDINQSGVPCHFKEKLEVPEDDAINPLAELENIDSIIATNESDTDIEDPKLN